MIRCAIEVCELSFDKKPIESLEPVSFVQRRMSFDELLFRDELKWRGLETTRALACAAELAQRELIAGDFARFVSWIAATQGHAFARAAGLPVGRPRLELAS